MDSINTNRYDSAINQYLNASPKIDAYWNTHSRESQAGGQQKNTYGNGQMIEGEIIDLKNDEISIRTQSGEVINAKVTDSSRLNIGSTVSFRASTLDDVLYLEPVLSQDDQTINVIVQRVLEAASLPTSQKNMLIAQTLLDNNMSVDKQSIQRIISQSYINQDASIESIVLMNKHDIPVVNDNARQFENYRNYEHRIVQELDNISKELPKVYDNITSGHTLMDVNSEIVKTLTSDMPVTEMKMDTMVMSAYQSPGDKDMLLSVLSHFKLNEKLEEQINNNTATLKDVAAAIRESYELATEMDMDRMSFMNSYSSGGGILSARALFENPVIQNITAKANEVATNNMQLSSFFSDLSTGTIVSMLKDIPNSDELASKVWQGDITANEFIKELESLLNDADAQAVRRILSSDEYKTVISKAVMSNWTLTVEDLQDESKIKKTYDKIYEQSERLSNLVEKTLGGTLSSSSLSRESANVRSNIDFMHTLNDMFSYIQLPMRLSGQNVHSELFVMTDKKKLAADNSNINVLLRLDMEALGTMDVRVNLKGNEVTAKFLLPDEKDLELFKVNMEVLEMGLLEKGFLFNSSVEQKEKEIDIVEDFIEKGATSSVMKRYTFDIRA